MSESVISAPPPVGRALSFPQPDGSEVPYRVFSSQEVYAVSYTHLRAHET